MILTLAHLFISLHGTQPDTIITSIFILVAAMKHTTTSMHLSRHYSLYSPFYSISPSLGSWTETGEHIATPTSTVAPTRTNIIVTSLASQSPAVATRIEQHPLSLSLVYVWCVRLEIARVREQREGSRISSPRHFFFWFGVFRWPSPTPASSLPTVVASFGEKQKELRSISNQPPTPSSLLVSFGFRRPLSSFSDQRPVELILKDPIIFMPKNHWRTNITAHTNSTHMLTKLRKKKKGIWWSKNTSDSILKSLDTCHTLLKAGGGYI